MGKICGKDFWEITAIIKTDEQPRSVMPIFRTQMSGFRVNEGIFNKSGPGAILRFLSPIIPQNLNLFILAVAEISCDRHTNTLTNGSSNKLG